MWLRCQPAKDSVALRSELAPPTPQDVIAEITQSDGDGSDGFARRKRTGVYRTIRMPVFDRFRATYSEVRPAAYLIPPEHSDLVAMLRAQGVIVFRSAGPWRGSVESFSVDSVSGASGVFEGHRAVTVTGRWAALDESVSAGWYYVPTTQRLGVFSAYLLEPMSEDGFVTWNFLDRDLQAGRAYPILRLRASISVPMELVQ